MRSYSQRFSRRYCRTTRRVIFTPSLDTKRWQKPLSIGRHPTYSTKHSFRTLASRLLVKGSPVILIEEVVRHLFDLVQLGPDNSDVVLTQLYSRISDATLAPSNRTTFLPTIFKKTRGQSPRFFWFYQRMRLPRSSCISKRACNYALPSGGVVLSMALSDNWTNMV